MRWRIDGVLRPAGSCRSTLPRTSSPGSRSWPSLLTYRTDVPQEGRIARLDRRGGGPGQHLPDAPRREGRHPALRRDRAAISGSTTWACRRTSARRSPGPPRDLGRDPPDRPGRERQDDHDLCLPPRAGRAVSQGRRSLATLEDPIEVAVPGVAQSQVNPSAGFDLATGLRSLLRQDPEVIAVGEIRDRSTAEVAFQASLTGHLVLSTFHAGSAVGRDRPALGHGDRALPASERPARRRLAAPRPDALRLRRRRPTTPSRGSACRSIGSRVAVGCEACGGTGYRGRMVLAELLDPERLGPRPGDPRQGRHPGPRSSRPSEAGMVGRWQRACQAIEDGLTSPAEVRRVLGFSEGPV